MKIQIKKLKKLESWLFPHSPTNRILFFINWILISCLLNCCMILSSYPEDIYSFPSSRSFSFRFKIHTLSTQKISIWRFNFNFNFIPICIDLRMPLMIHFILVCYSRKSQFLLKLIPDKQLFPLRQRDCQHDHTNHLLSLMPYLPKLVPCLFHPKDLNFSNEM